ncbi:delta-1-pyrroline-5-carboxylate dehydrogenase, mitochondrial precursor [Pochonia chlamydosporia 170]|uniref:Multifunctional fusion protein n=1 Tax=Pochonia chlamydosporia 170 TaxID=1380566 RepID=A0A179F6N3_METCM|nr:delta-1-pyrroline-5-carboxylate dehydrogenase, mitochondrial precursor [Pochonia chlamydosporia 170]OAQ61114.1 delta-1-pyrroline-5-carboxylate dehydrogenase, mitochondrial precursor [Pochonia chlamydosporia 170]
MFGRGQLQARSLRASQFFHSTKTRLPTQTVWMSTAGQFRVPKPFNERNRAFTPSSPERQTLQDALDQLKAQLPVTVPSVIAGSEISESRRGQILTKMPSKQSQIFAKSASATPKDVERAIDAALAAKAEWSTTPFNNRAGVFLRAAELVTGKYRDQLLASTMLGQGKNAWQAEIDAAAELADFFRFNVSFAQEIYERQPELIAPGESGRTDWRPLEGFVYAVSPFNFTAIGGNLVSAPALMGNVVVWKPSPHSIHASYLVYKILLEAGLPPNVVQFVSGDAREITDIILNHPRFAALHFTGSSEVFRALHLKVAEGIASNKFVELPRLVGETSGKNFHLLHHSADIPNAAKQTIRAAFEYAGQKCSACSRVYVPQSRAEQFFNEMRAGLETVRIGPPEQWENFAGPVIHKDAFDKISNAIDKANQDADLENIYGGTYDSSEGLYINPSIYISNTPNHELFHKEFFGPVLVAYIYPDDKFEETLELVDNHGGGFALTGSVFASDRMAIALAEEKLRYSAGNFYTNSKTTGAVIGQQSFGGGRSSGTNDKAGSVSLVQRFASPRTLKEDFKTLDSVLYPSNQ